MRVTSTFDVDRFDQDDPYHDRDEVSLARAHLDKTFSGDIEGSSTVEMLSARSDGAPAGYVALEHLDVTLDGRRGTFVLLHAGTMEGDQQWARWPIVPGTGTGELRGISGQGRIQIDEDGTHSLILECELP